MNSIEFASPHFLMGLIIIPLLIVWYILNCNKQQAYVRFSDTSFFEKLPKSWKTYLRHIVFILKIASLALFIVALARPQSSTMNQKINVEGIDIVLAMDISSSMLACDLQPDRLEASKIVASDFVAGRPDDRMGLVVFSRTRCCFSKFYQV